MKTKEEIIKQRLSEARNDVKRSRLERYTIDKEAYKKLGIVLWDSEFEINHTNQ